jgi:hypothetical protein
MINKYKDQFKIKRILKDGIKEKINTNLMLKTKIKLKKKVKKQNEINYSLNIHTYYTNSKWSLPKSYL